MMLNLQESLKEYDLHLLQIIANRWDVDLDTRDVDIAAERLATAMSVPDKVAVEWERLKDNERGALQTLLASFEHKMPTAHYARLFGEIRHMGPDRREREKPHLNTEGVAEVLYYRGLLYLMFDEGKTGVQSFVYVPADLADVLPTRQVSFEMEDDEASSQPADTMQEIAMPSQIAQADDPLHVHRTDTSIVDDLTTILAYIHVHQVQLDQGVIPADLLADMQQHMIEPSRPDRLEMILYLGVEVGLIVEEDGHLLTVRQAVRSWLEYPRTRQVKTLVDGWQRSTLFNELWQVPDLVPEETGWRNDPLLLRQTLRETLQFLYGGQWLSLAGMIAEIKEADPDFQRPSGDYTGWYIRDRQSGDYLTGFEYWDRIEGAMLHYAVIGPLYWLGLLDLGGETPDKSDSNAFKLNAFGKAWIERNPWPVVKDPETQLEIDADGQILVPRAANRYDRFQLARFSTWGPSGDPYRYTLTSTSLKHADTQGIRPEHIRAFLQRTTGQPLPTGVQSLLDTWETTGGASIVLEHLLVLQLDAPDLMKLVWETPAIRRFLGRQLGPLAVTVRADQWEGLVAALEQQGIPIDARI